jgi:tricorn protease
VFFDRANRLAFVTLETGAVTIVAENSGTLGTWGPSACWSPDSKWIAYERKDPATLFDHIELFEVATSKTTRVTDAIGDADSPAFSRDGTYLFFRSSTDAGPRQFGLDMSTNTGRRTTASLYVVVLRKDGKNPLAEKSDEVDEKPAAKGKDGGKEGEKPAGKPAEKPTDKPTDKPADKDEKPAKDDKDEKGEKSDKGDEAAEGAESAAKGDAGTKADKGPSIDVDGLDPRRQPWASSGSRP